MSRQTLKVCQIVAKVVDSVVVNHAHIIKGQPQNRGVSPAVVRRLSLKYVNNVSCVNQLCSVKHVPNVRTVAQDLPVSLGHISGCSADPSIALILRRFVYMYIV